MTFISHRLWFFSYYLQGFDTGLSTWDLIQNIIPINKLYYVFNTVANLDSISYITYI